MNYQWWQCVGMFFAGVNFAAIIVGLRDEENPVAITTSVVGCVAGLIAGWP